MSKYDARLHEFALKHPNRMTSEIVHSIVYDEPLTRQDEGQDFVEYVTKTLKAKLTTGRIGKSRYENSVSCMKGFTQFLLAKELGTYKKDAIYLGDVTEDLVLKYIDYRAFYNYWTLNYNRTLYNHWGVVMVMMWAWCNCYYRSVVVVMMARCDCYYRSVMVTIVMTHLYSVMMTIVMTLC